MSPDFSYTKNFKPLQPANPWKSIGLRGLLCLSIGLSSFLFNHGLNYDPHFQMRGSQKTTKNIVLLTVSPEDLEIFKKNIRSQSNDSSLFQDDSQVWQRILSYLQTLKPQHMGVTVTFKNKTPGSQFKLLKSPPNSYWLSSHSLGKQVRPFFLEKTNHNFGASYLQQDMDGVNRRYHFPANQVTFLEEISSSKVNKKENMPLINFRGKKNSFTRIQLKQLLLSNEKRELLKGRYVLVGPDEKNDKILLTPLGLMTKLEFLANVLDNLLEKRWIKKLPWKLCVLYLIFLLIGAIWLMTKQSHKIGLSILFLTGATTTILSLWIFNNFGFWIPIFAPLLTLIMTYIIFLSYQISVKENINWQLEKENHLQREGETIKSNFVSLISHDLKTPIAKIQAICDRLLQQGLSLQLTKDIKNLRHASSELHRHIQSILKLSRAEAQNLKINKEAADINEIITNTIEQVEPIAKEKNISIEKKLEPLFLIEIDSILIQEVILNVIENAIKYSSENKSISIQTEEQDNQIKIQVTDSGQGISESDQKRVFDKFYRSPNQTSIKGTGLGLYFVKYFVELHEGHISIDSQINKGTQVTIYLPC